MGNVDIEGIAYYDGQFKAGIPEGLLTFPFYPNHKKDQRSLFLSSPALYCAVHRYLVTGVIQRPTQLTESLLSFS